MLTVLLLQLLLESGFLFWWSSFLLIVWTLAPTMTFPTVRTLALALTFITSRALALPPTSAMVIFLSLALSDAQVATVIMDLSIALGRTTAPTSAPQRSPAWGTLGLMRKGTLVLALAFALNTLALTAMAFINDNG